MKVRPKPCATCPYRKDVAPGVWDATEYEKLPAYDAETWGQPQVLFMCHAEPGQCCSGWATCHTARGREYDLLALRLAGCPEVPRHGVEVFASGQDAHDHGISEIDNPGIRVREAIEKVGLLRGDAKPTEERDHEEASSKINQGERHVSRARNVPHPHDQKPYRVA